MTAISASRGQDIREYIPALKKGAVIPLSCLSAGFTTGITANGILSAHISAAAVTSIKILFGAVISAKIGISAIHTRHLSAGCVTKNSIADGAVTSAKIGALAIHNGNLSSKCVTSAKVRAAFLSGTISGLLSGCVAVAHGLGVKPKMAIVTTLATHGNVTGGHYVFLAAASAATTTNIYLKASKSGNIKYAAYVQL